MECFEWMLYSKDIKSDLRDDINRQQKQIKKQMNVSILCQFYNYLKRGTKNISTIILGKNVIIEIIPKKINLLTIDYISISSSFVLWVD